MAEGFKSAAHYSLAAVQAARLRWKKSLEARRALAVLAQSGRSPSPAMTRRARNEARERFGASRHAEWLMLYAAVQGEYREGWVPDSYYLETVMPRINGISHHLARTRAATPCFFDDPSICDLLYTVNGRFLGPDQTPLTWDDVRERLSAQAPEVVFKADHSGFGKGVRILTVADLGPEQLRTLGNGVFQRKIAPHPKLARFGSNALATLRIGTAITPSGEPEVRCCYLKIGRPGQSIVVARDQIRISVDWRSGAADATGYLSDWRPVTAPPGSDTRFEGFTVPSVVEAAGTAVSLHRQLPLPGYVCWDFAIDAHGAVRLLEWEGGVVSFAEAVQGPCFAGLGWLN